MANRWTNTLTRADVTPRGLFLNRRQMIAGAAGLSAAGFAGMAQAQDALEPNTIEEISNYNNYYEFGTGKEDPAANAGGMVCIVDLVDSLGRPPGQASVNAELKTLERAGLLVRAEKHQGERRVYLIPQPSPYWEMCRTMLDQTACKRQTSRPRRDTRRRAQGVS